MTHSLNMNKQELKHKKECLLLIPQFVDWWNLQQVNKNLSVINYLEYHYNINILKNALVN